MTHECQEFVDSEVVHLVPVLVQNVQSCLEPLLLATRSTQLLHDLANLDGGLPLVDRFISMPKHYKLSKKEGVSINQSFLSLR